MREIVMLYLLGFLLCWYNVTDTGCKEYLRYYQSHNVPVNIFLKYLLRGFFIAILWFVYILRSLFDD